MKSFDFLSNFFQFYVKKSKEKYHKNMSDYVEVENLPTANELINDDYVLINQNEDDAKVDMGTIKEFVRPPNASPTESGLVSTAEQTFSGKKNFTEIASNKATISSLNSSNATLTEATVQDLHITGNLIQDGETIETEVETLKVKDQVIVTRSGATTGMTDGEVTGIVAEKYDGQNNGVLVFGSDGIARVGDEGDTQPLATREETPNNGSIQVWDEQTQSLKSFPFGQKGQYLRQGENGLEYGSAVAVDGTASEEYVDQKVQEEATLRQNAIEELDAKKAEISDTSSSTTSTYSSDKINEIFIEKKNLKTEINVNSSQYLKVAMPVNMIVTFILSMKTTTGNGYTTFLVTNYGIGGNLRCRVQQLQGEQYFIKYIDDCDLYIQPNSSDQAWNVTAMSVQGNVPTLSASDTYSGTEIKQTYVPYEIASVLKTSSNTEVTNITFNSDYVVPYIDRAINKYFVRNGVCYVTLDCIVKKNVNNFPAFVLPASIIPMYFSESPFSNETGNNGAFNILTNGSVLIHDMTIGKRIITSFCYPIA